MIEAAHTERDHIQQWLDDATSASEVPNETSINGPEQGLATRLHLRCLHLLRCMYERERDSTSRSQAATLKRELGRLYLWGESFAAGCLDRALEQSDGLRDTILGLLCAMGELLIRESLSSLDRPTDRIQELEVLVKQTRSFLLNRDCEVKQHSNGIDEDSSLYTTDLSDIEFFNTCLIELGPTLERYVRCEDETRSQPFQPALASKLQVATSTALKAYARSPEDEERPFWRENGKPRQELVKHVGRHTGESAITAFLRDRDRLPNPEAKSASIGEDYMETSRLHARNDCSPNDSLRALTRITSRISQSVLDGIGERQMTRNMRILVPDPEGVLDTTTLPPLRRPNQDPILECPFTFIKCFRQFAVTNEQAWIKHSLDHFRIDRRRPRIVDPPKVNSCCFYSRTFQAVSGIDSWQERMDHVKVHHQYLGHRLEAARHDFALVEYFWQNGLLSTADYRELKGDRMRNAQENLSPPDLPDWAGAASRSAEDKPSPPD